MPGQRQHDDGHLVGGQSAVSRGPLFCLDHDVQARRIHSNILRDQVSRDLLIDLLLTVHGPQRRHHGGQKVVREQSHAESKESGLGISQRGEFRVEPECELLKRRLDAPALLIENRDLNGTGHLFREVREEVKFHVAVSRRLVEPDCDPAEVEGAAVLHLHPHVLFEDLAGLDPSARDQCAERASDQVRVLTNHERAVSLLNAPEERSRAEVPVADPAVAGRYHRQDLRQDQPLLSVAVLARNHRAHQSQGGLEDREQMARQWAGHAPPQHGQATIGRREMVAIEHHHPKPRQPRRSLPFHRPDQHGGAVRRAPDHRGADSRFDVLELLVDRLQGDPHLAVRVRGAHRRLATRHDQTEQVDRGRERQLVGVRFRAAPLENLVERRARKAVLQADADHQRERGTRRVPAEDVLHDRRGLVGRHGSRILPELSQGNLRSCALDRLHSPPRCGTVDCCLHCRLLSRHREMDGRIRTGLRRKEGASRIDTWRDVDGAKGAGQREEMVARRVSGESWGVVESLLCKRFPCVLSSKRNVWR